MGSLDGQISLVTGASQGIGKGTALALAEAGSTVVLGARNVEKMDAVAAEIRQRGGEALVVRLDVTSHQSVKDAVATALDHYGRIDILVNNAGSNNGSPDGALGPIWEINPDAWWYDVEVNLHGTFLCTHEVLPSMVANKKGHIVNVASMAALWSWPYDTAYSCSKAAVVRMTDSVAQEVKDRGVYLFAISPGAVDTELLHGAIDSEAGQKYLPTVGEKGVYVPVERPANYMVYLCSGEADGLTGRMLSCAWDVVDLARRSDEIAERDLLSMRLTYDDKVKAFDE